MRTTTRSALLLMTLLASGCAQDSPMPLSPDAVTAEFARDAVKMVPFRATYTAQAGFTPVGNAVCSTGLADMTQGTGQATHLGRITGETFSCINLATLQATQGRFTFTAPDGSQVSGTYELQGTPLSETLLRLEGPFTITGGTRRFEGASGGGQVTGTVDFATNELVLNFDGMVSSVGSPKQQHR